MSAVKAVRGAIQVAENSPREIHRASRRLVQELMKSNGLEETRLISIIFSMTRDLNKANPAAGLRAGGFAGVPLFCVQEAEVEGGMERILRVLLTFTGPQEQIPRAVYLDGAEALRPDLRS